jgi:hypothetical protein
MPPTQVTIPLGGVDAAGRPLPPTTTYLTGEGGAGLGNWEPYRPPAQGEGAPAEPAPSTALGNWEPYQAPEQPAAPEVPRQVSGGEAFVGGLAHGATFGAAPAIAGLAAASGMDLPQQAETGALDQPAGMALLRPFVGAYKLLTEGTERVKAYNEARDKALKDYEEAQKQHPFITAAGSAAGGLAVTPALGPLGSLRAASVLGRVAQGVKVGGVTGGLTGAGEATSKGEAPIEVAKQAGVGAGVGGVLGGVLGGAIETGSGIARAISSTARGHRDPELEAARLVADAARRGQPATERLVRDPLALRVGQAADTPVFNVDVMGAPGRRLLRRTTNLSPEAQDVAAEAIFPRFAGQGERAGDWFLSRFGGGDVGATLQGLQRAAAAANRPNYLRAQAYADRFFPAGIWSPRLEQLASSSALPRAAQIASEKGADRAVLEGMGGFNPGVSFNNGILTVQRGGRRGFPDLRFWDYTQRAMRDMEREASRAGRTDEAAAIGQLQRELLAELDRLVPPFGHARGVAARFFGANDALQAGEQFVSANQINGKKLRDPEVARLVAAMNPAERALFQYGFVTELVRKLGQVGDNRNVINQIANTRNARARIATAMGPGALEETLALVRIESLIDRARTAAFGNSTSAQQLGDIVGGAAVGSSGFSLQGIVTGAILFAARQLHHTVDEQVMANVARMLVSEDPAIYARGVAIAARNPVIRETLRRASDLSTRELISQATPYGAAASLATAASRIGGYGKPAAEPQHHYYEEDPQRGVSSFQQGP